MAKKKPVYERNVKGQFLNGNPGKPKGARPKFQQLFDKKTNEAADLIVYKILDLVEKGDSRILGKFQSFGLRRLRVNPIKGLSGSKPGKAVLSAVESGEISVEEGLGLSRIIQTAQLEDEIQELKERLDNLGV